MNPSSAGNFLQNWISYTSWYKVATSTLARILVIIPTSISQWVNLEKFKTLLQYRWSAPCESAILDSPKIPEDMLDDLIMSLGGFCHVTCITSIDLLDDWFLALHWSQYTWDHRLSHTALFIVDVSTRGEIGNPARSISGQIGTLVGLQMVRPYFSISMNGFEKYGHWNGYRITPSQFHLVF